MCAIEIPVSLKPYRALKMEISKEKLVEIQNLKEY